jgi:peptide/nickel transport system permease protein
MAAFLLRRLGFMILTLFLLSLIIFFAGQVLPGDPGRAVLGPFAANSAVQALDHSLGVDQPLVTRYLDWLGGLLHGISVNRMRTRARSRRSSGPR